MNNIKKCNKPYKSGANSYQAKKNNHANTKHLLVVDPIAFFGGSKVASTTLLQALQKRGFDISVITADTSSWTQTNFSVSKIVEIKCLAQAEQGIAYYLKHVFIYIQLLVHILLRSTFSSKKYCAIAGISGPGVDISMYWASLSCFIPSIQLVHGPVAHSRLINYFMPKAGLIASLNSELNDIKQRLSSHPKSTSTKISEMRNGISEQNWPSSTDNAFKTPRLYWCASLLKWKGLDRFITSLQQAQKSIDISAEVNFIAPKASLQACSNIPQSTNYLDVAQQPKDKDARRSACNIFVSTSINEPFGLSILEALCTGLCVVIPADGAHWDQQLKHGKNCIKYPPTTTALTQTLLWLGDNMTQVKRIADNGKKLALNYRAENTYKQTLDSIEGIAAISSKKHLSTQSINTQQDELIAIKQVLQRFSQTHSVRQESNYKTDRGL